MASYNRSLLSVALAAIAGWAFAAYGYVSTATGDIAYRVVELVLLPLKWLFQPDYRHVELTHRLHDTRADDVRRNAPFKSFMNRARQNPLFVNDHFRAPVIVGT